MSELVEKVRQAVRPHLYSEGGNSEVVARAAIAAVAEWLDPNARPEIYGHDNTASEIVAAQLLKQLEQSE